MIDWFILRVEAKCVYQKGGREKDDYLPQVGGCFPESQPSRDSRAPFVSPSCIRRTAAPSMQMLSVLSSARSDGFRNGSEFRKEEKKSQ